jgi:hypothetical protein
MSSIVQRHSAIANHQEPDQSGTSQPSYAGLNAAALNKGVWPENLATRLANLIAEHDDLDQAVASMLCALGCNDLAISRLKKRKLQIKDEISHAQACIMRELAGCEA